MDTDDFIQDGWVGALDSWTRFDPDAGVRFSKFARKRVKGEVVESLRRNAPISRHMYGHLKLMNEVVNEQEESSGIVPSDKDLEELTGLTKKQIGNARALDPLETKTA